MQKKPSQSDNATGTNRHPEQAKTDFGKVCENLATKILCKRYPDAPIDHGAFSGENGKSARLLHFSQYWKLWRKSGFDLVFQRMWNLHFMDLIRTCTARSTRLRRVEWRKPQLHCSTLLVRKLENPGKNRLLTWFFTEYEISTSWNLTKHVRRAQFDLSLIHIWRCRRAI